MIYLWVLLIQSMNLPHARGKRGAERKSLGLPIFKFHTQIQQRLSVFICVHLWLHFHKIDSCQKFNS